MKVAYVLNTPRAASYKVAQMILPQLEAGTHGVEVVGIPRPPYFALHGVAVFATWCSADEVDTIRPSAAAEVVRGL